MKSKKITLLILFVVLTIQAHSQEHEPKPTLLSMPSPNVASLGVFGEFPATLSTGVPNITVPLYNLEYRGVTVPISLSYNPNLVKPDIHSGWVGLGWNLNAGGYISRVVKEAHDLVNRTEPYVAWGYYYNNAFFADPDWASTERIQEAIDHRNQYGILSVKDTEPDEFTFSFLGFSGVFYLDETRNWKVRSEKKLDLVAELNGDWVKFTFTDGNGVRYIFGDDPTKVNVEFSEALVAFSADSYNERTWYLTRIEIPGAGDINFKYERGNNILLPQLDWHNALATGTGLMFTGSQVKPSYLTEISTENHTIKFKRSNSNELKYDYTRYQSYHDLLNTQTMGNFNLMVIYNSNGTTTYVSSMASLQQAFNNFPFQKLDAISIESKTEVINNVLFDYNNVPTDRLKLRKVICSGKEHSFFYHDDFDSNLKLPDYFANQLDYWGYYNGREADYTNETNFNLSREPDGQKLKSGVLRKVIYPTGGYTLYDFEAHDYSKELDLIRYNPLHVYSANTLAGGLRIKQITNYDSNDGIQNSISYSYTTGYSASGPTGLSSGILGGFSKIRYHPPTGGSTLGFADIYSRYPLCHNNNGSHVGYSTVTEIFSNGSYAVNTFSNFDNGVNNEYMDEPPFFMVGGSRYQAFQSKAFERGKLLKKEVFRVENAVEKKVKESQYTYERINPSTNYVRSLDIDQIFQVITEFTTVDPSAIKIYTYPYLLSTVSEKTYDQEDPGNEAKAISHLTAYSYVPVGESIPSEDLQVRKVTQANLNGESVITEYKYVGDYPLIEDPIGAPAEAIVNLKQNKVNAMVESLTYLQKTESGQQVKYFMDGLLTKYKIFSNGQAYPSDAYKLKFSPGASFTTYDWTRMTGKTFIADMSKFKLIATYTNYDGWGNLLQATGRDGIPMTYTWGHNNSLLTSATKNYDPNPLVSQHQSQFYHKPLVGVYQMVDPNGLSTNFSYDLNQRLSFISDHNGNILQRYRYHYQNQNEFSIDFSVSGAPKTNSGISFQSLIDQQQIGGTTYVWDFGDGQVFEGSSPSVSHNYSGAGNYTVKLSKVNPEYGAITTSKPYTIYPPPSITAVSNCTTLYLCKLETANCTLAASVSGGCPGANIQWYRRTGTEWTLYGSGETVNFNPHFSEASHEFKCTITDGSGCGQTAESNVVTINVLPNPNCDQN